MHEGLVRARNLSRRSDELKGATEPAKRATVLAFVVLGVVNSSWAARVPQVREDLGLDGPQLGLLLLCIAVGAVSALPGAGPLIARIGSRRTLRLGLALTVVGLAIAAVGVSSRRIAIVAAGLFVYGTATALWDIAINLQGTAVERALGRSFLPRLHATYSAGSVGGALLGVVAIVLGISPAVDLGAIGVLAAAVVWWASRRFLPDAHQSAPRRRRRQRRRPDLRSWREPRTLLLGGMVLGFALTEGSGNDWVSVSVVQHDHVSPALGTLALGSFLASMTLARWRGGELLARFGRVATLRVLAGLAVTGIAVFCVAGGIVGSVCGTVLWGLGASLGIPVAYSAGADEPHRAATRVGTITSIGYLAYLGGPPLIGLAVGAVGLPRALGLTGVVLAASALLTGAARPVTPTEPPADQGDL